MRWSFRQSGLIVAVYSPLARLMPNESGMRTKMLQRTESPIAKANKEERPTVLVVEDHQETREFMTGVLTAEGMSCVNADSVDSALKFLRKEKVSAMVLDWGLDRSGAEVLAVAKQLYPKMPVVAISGMPFEVRTDAVVNKADAFLNKPFSATVLVNQVKQLIERTRQEPSIELPQRAEDILPLEQVQMTYIRHVVELLEGNKSRAAEALGIHRQTISSALKEKPDN
jgi:two-component system response regulator RegA